MTNLNIYELICKIHKRHTCLFVAVMYILMLSGFCLLVDFNGLYGQDSYAYLLYTKKITAYFFYGHMPGNFFWPAGYPFVSALLNVLVRNENISCVLVSILSSALCFVFLYKLLCVSYPEQRKNVTVFLVLFYCLSPFVIRTSVIIMSEMLAMCLISGCFYYYSCYWNSGKIYYFFLGIILSFLSVIVRYPCFIVIISPLIFSCIRFFKNIKRRQLIAFIFLVLVFVFCVRFSFGEHLSWEFLKNKLLISWSFLNYFRNDFDTIDGLSHYTFINILYPLALLINPGFITGGFLLVFFLKRTQVNTHVYLIVILSMVFYSLFLAGIPFQNLRVLSLIYPLVLIVLFPAFMNAEKKIFFINKHHTLFLIVMVLIQLCFTARAVYPFYKMNKDEKIIAVSLEKYRHYKTLYTSGTEGLIQVYCNYFILKNIWEKQISFFASPSLVLINPEELERQWKGKNPAINWNTLKKNYVVLKLENLPSGWELYEVR